MFEDFYRATQPYVSKTIDFEVATPNIEVATLTTSIKRKIAKKDG